LWIYVINIQRKHLLAFYFIESKTMLYVFISNIIRTYKEMGLFSQKERYKRASQS